MSRPNILVRAARFARRESVPFWLLTKIARVLVPRYRFKWPTITCWEDSAFDAYLERFDELRGMNTDRKWMLYQLLRLVEGVPGDTAECGVWRGASSYLICQANARSARHERTHYLFDSFEGLSEPSDADGSHWTPGDLACGLEDVKKNLADFANVSFHRGWIPERFDEVADRQFAFVHVDVDLHQPTRDSLEFFYPRLSDGAILLCDDYGSTLCPGADRAVDEFLADKPEKMLPMSSGGGFLVKGRETGPASLT